MEEWQKPETIILWLTVGIVFLLLLLLFIIILIKTMFNKMVQNRIAKASVKWQHQQDLLESTIETQEIERKRIAEDLHDALIGKLIVLQMENQINVKYEPFKVLIEEGINTARRISHDLSPPLIEYTPLIELISDILTPWEKVKSIISNFDVRVEITHTDSFKINLTRILQEVITNIIKHAEAKKIEVRLRQTESSLIIVIEDNGVGFDTQKNIKGLGLTNIETRVKYLKGHYKVKSTKSKGTTNLFFFNMK